MAKRTGISRRSLLAGLGGAAAGVTLSGREALAAPGDPPGVPTVKTAENAHLDQGVILQALPAVNPNWIYRTLAYHHFIPRVVAGLNVSSDGTVGMHVTAPAAGTNFFAPLDLPQGAVLHEAAFECFNNNATTSLGVGITRTSLGSANVGGNFAFTTTLAQKHTVVVTPSIIGPIDNTAFAYGLSAFLRPPASEFGFFGVRLAYENGLRLAPVRPSVRKYDTRAPAAGGKMSVGQTRNVSLLPQVPAGAKAALLNVTVASTEGFSGFLTLYAAGTPRPGTSNIKWALPNLNLANAATVAVSPASAISIFCGGSPNNRAHVIVDLVGYYS
jgi:hypothetical protein